MAWQTLNAEEMSRCSGAPIDANGCHDPSSTSVTSRSHWLLLHATDDVNPAFVSPSNHRGEQMALAVQRNIPVRVRQGARSYTVSSAMSPWQANANGKSPIEMKSRSSATGARKMPTSSYDACNVASISCPPASTGLTSMRGHWWWNRAIAGPTGAAASGGNA